MTPRAGSPLPDPTERFGDRVQAYTRYRPSYPREVIGLLHRECGLRAGSTVADVGSGTGILCALLLDAGAVLHAVEPNREMRAAAERSFAGHERFFSVAGRAEATGLAAGCVDLITAAQAFHWFDRARTREEFARVLRPAGFVALAWNDRDKRGSAFACDYERLLLDFAVDYRDVDHQRIADADIDRFFAPGRCAKAEFSNRQVLDFAGLEGRLMSCSYAPQPGHPRHHPMIRRLRALHAAHAEDGRVAMSYTVRVFYGRLSANDPG